ncbi:MAG: MHYT domain-containing protein [Gammaproteobacteria bacterium]
MMDLNWFQVGPLPANIITGTYSYKLVALSYLIAVLASYVALDLAGRLRAETNKQIQYYWLIGGSFTMGAGIWSMHFIGMLAFVMPMPMSYELTWTILSLFVAMLASGIALYILRVKQRPVLEIAIGGVFMGLAIATMHYMGMEGMKSHVDIHYLPGLFFLSIGIAIAAAEAALWLVLESNQGTFKRQIRLKIVSALVMGAAICGMHYTGMAAAVFTPLTHTMMATETIQPYLLAFFIAGITGLITSIALTISTYYRQLINAVQNEKEFLNVMLDNIENGIIACDAVGKITVFNEILQKYLPIRRNGKASNNLSEYFDLYPLNSNTPITIENSPLYRALQNEHFQGLEFNLTFKHGETRQVTIDGQPIINAEGRKLGAVIVIHDVTEIKKTEKIKNEFVAVVSHELRTPLTSIRGSLGLILGGITGEMPSKMKSLLEIANNNCERLVRLINDILDVEKIEAGKMNFIFTQLDIATVIESAIAVTKSIADKAQIELIFKSTKKMEVRGDYDRLMQVLVNLISNAIRFSRPGQAIRITTSHNEKTTRIAITDQGEGITEEFHSRIFQKFAQANTSNTRSKGGTGLGLSICKAIIERHDGTIDFTSHPGEGACFYFELPNFDAQEDTKTPTLVDGKVSSPVKILVCDSNPDTAEYLQKFLLEHNIESDLAFTAHQASEMLHKNHYNAMTLDLILSDSDGIKFINELRMDPVTRQIPIVVISSIIEDGKHEFNGNGFPVLDWIEKPIDKARLEKLITYISDKFPKILCIEDDIDVAKIFQLLLKDEANVVVASTLARAKELLSTEGFDLIILDLILPDGMGTDILPCVNCETKKIIPVIVFSASVLDKKYAHLVKASLVKSKVSNEELIAIIHSAIASRDKIV